MSEYQTYLETSTNKLLELQTDKEMKIHYQYIVHSCKEFNYRYDLFKSNLSDDIKDKIKCPKNGLKIYMEKS